MADYFLVAEGAIVEGPMPLPVSWRNISGLRHLTAAKLKALGWIPQELIGFEPFDAATQFRTEPTHLVLAFKVVSTYVVTDKTAQEIDDEKEVQAEKTMNRGLAALAKGIADVQEQNNRFIVAADMSDVATRTKFYLKENL